MGLDLAVVLTFDAALASLPPEDFIARVLVEGLGVRHVVIGYDFFFGKGRRGTPETMQGAAAKHGFGVTIIAPVADDGEVLSSSAIRLRLAQGDVKGAAHMLGRWWRVAGTVVGGAKRGGVLGFPTANIPLPAGTGLGHGIYAVRTYIDGERHERHDAAAYLGTRPTYDNGMPVLEVFLFDFDGDLYGRKVEVEFIDFVREDRKFDSSQALIAQMRADCDKARAALAAHQR
jgi:riboflavin kinase/FMN adenylyltransferase